MSADAMIPAEPDVPAPAGAAVLTPWVCGDVPAQAASVPEVRRALVEFARRHGAGDRLASHIGLAVSEAVDNAVVHAYDEGVAGHVHYAADVDDGDLEIVVCDAGRGIRAETESDGLGLGLRLIAALTSDFAITHRAQGLEVWMRFVLDGATA